MKLVIYQNSYLLRSLHCMMRFIALELLLWPMWESIMTSRNININKNTPPPVNNISGLPLDQIIWRVQCSAVEMESNVPYALVGLGQKSNLISRRAQKIWHLAVELRSLSFWTSELWLLQHRNWPTRDYIPHTSPLQVQKSHEWKSTLDSRNITFVQFTDFRNYRWR